MGLQSRAGVAGLVFLVVLVLGASCRNPIGPPPPPPPPPPGPRTISIVLAGPATVAPGGAAEFTVTAQREDGSALDVTRETVWSSSVPSTATVSVGLVRGLAVGETNISAIYIPPGQTAFPKSTQIIVIPDGTYRVVGSVNEAGLGGIPGARVEVTSGTGAGLSTITDGGSYSLYGVAGDARIVATKPGYRDDVRELRVTAHQVVNFSLIAGDSIPAVEGSYMLTIVSAPSCGGVLREDLRVRTYSAQVSRS